MRPELKLIAFTICMLFATKTIVRAQINHEVLDKPDTLSVLERLSVSTNVVDWVMQLPNISLEYELGSTTWNHWAVGVKVRGNWQNTHTYKPAQVYNFSEVRGEVRYYWRTRLYSKEDAQKRKDEPNRKQYLPFPKNTNILKKLFSCRRDTLKHPNTTYYRGAYVAYNNFSLLIAKEGKQGSSVGAGFLYGIVKPLYQFKNGNALDMDLGISGGLYFTRYDKFEHNRESDCYHRLSTGAWHLSPIPMINELRLGLVYRFTKEAKHQLPERYRWRYDVDKKYREALDDSLKSLEERVENDRKEQERLDSIQKYFDKIFFEVYPEYLKQSQEEQSAKAEEARKKAEAEKASKLKAKEDEKLKAQKEKDDAKKAKEEEKLKAQQEKEQKKQQAAAEKAAKKGKGSESTEPTDPIAPTEPTAPAAPEEAKESPEEQPTEVPATEGEEKGGDE